MHFCRIEVRLSDAELGNRPMGQRLDLVLDLEYMPRVPLYRRLSDALRKAILDGRLLPGQPMPSIRDLSLSQKVSRATVIKAFDDLNSQGLIESKTGSGTFVCTTLPGDMADMIASLPKTFKTRNLDSIKVSNYSKRLLSLAGDYERYIEHSKKGNFFAPPPELVPLKRWKGLLMDYVRSNDSRAIDQDGDPFGYRPLRQEIASLLKRRRGVECDPDRVVVFGAKQGRLDIILKILTRPGDEVVFEEPGYTEARLTFQAYGAQIIPVPVDQFGIKIDALPQFSENVKAAYVTPSRQDPTGATLPLERRKELLLWAAENHSFIFEDDTDSEYRYGVPLVPSLQSLDQNDCVVYIASFWKVLFPVLNFGFAVIPERLKNLMMKAKIILDRYMPLPEQYVLARFIGDGYLEKCIKKNNSIYALRKQRLALALGRYFGDKISFTPSTAGTQQLVNIDSPLSDPEIENLAANCSFPVVSTAPHYMHEPSKGEFIIPFLSLEPYSIDRMVERWALSLLEAEARCLE